MKTGANISDSAQVMIHIIRGRATRKSRPLRTSLLVGSGVDCDVQMRSAEVAPRHCRLFQYQGKVWAEAIDAQFPMLHNGIAVTQIVLRNGDHLGIGPFELAIEIPESLAPQQSGPATEGPDAITAVHADQSVPPSSQGAQEKSGQGSVTRQTGDGSPTRDGFRFEMTHSNNQLGLKPSNSATSAAQQTDPAMGFAGQPELAQSLAHVEAELQRLEHASEQLRRHQESVEQASRTLTDRQLQLDAQESALREKETQLSHQLATLDQERKQLLEQEQSLTQNSERIIRIRQRLARHYQEREAELVRKDQQAAQRLLEADSARVAINHRATELEQRAAELEVERQQVRHHSAKLLQNVRQLEAEQRSFKKLWEHLRDDIEASNRRAEQLDEQSTDVAQLRQLLDAERAKLALREDEIAAERAQHAQQEARFQDLINRLEADLSTATQSNRLLPEREQELAAHRESLQEELSALEQRRGELDAWHHDIAGKAESIAELARTLAQREEQINQQEAAVHESEKRLLDEMNELHEQVSQLRAENNRQLEETDQQKQQIQHEREDWTRQLAQDRQELALERADLERSSQQLRKSMTMLLERTSFMQQQSVLARRNRIELAQRASIVAVNQRRVHEKSKLNQDQQQNLLQRETSLQSKETQLSKAAQDLDQRAQSLDDRSKQLDQEAVRLRSLAHQLDLEHQQKAHDQKQCKLDLDRQRGELEQLSAEIARRKETIEVQLGEQREHVSRLEITAGKLNLHNREQAKQLDALRDQYRQQEQQLLANLQRMTSMQADVEHIRRVAQPLEHEARRCLDQLAGDRIYLADTQSELSTLLADTLVLNHELVAQEPGIPLTTGLLAPRLSTLTNRLSAIDERLNRCRQRLSNRYAELDSILAQLRSMRATMQRYSEELATTSHRQESHVPAAAKTQVAERSASLDAQQRPSVTSASITPMGESVAPALAVMAPQEIDPDRRASAHEGRAVLESHDAPNHDVADEEPQRFTFPMHASAGLGHAIGAERPRADEPHPTSTNPSKHLISPEPKLVASEPVVLTMPKPVIAELPAAEQFKQTPASVEPPALNKRAVVTSMSLAWPTIPGMEILEELHHGSVARTFLARRVGQAKQVAIRLLRRDFSKEAVRVEQYERALRDASTIRHPTLAPIQGFFKSKELAGVARSYIDGTPLDQMFSQRVPADLFIQALVDGLVAIGELHQHGSSANLLKPSSFVWSKDGRLVLLNYGEPEFIALAYLCEKPDAVRRYRPPELQGKLDRPALPDELFAVAAIFQHWLEVGQFDLAGIDQPLWQSVQDLVHQSAHRDSAQRLSDLNTLFRKLESIGIIELAA